VPFNGFRGEGPEAGNYWFFQAQLWETFASPKFDFPMVASLKVAIPNVASPKGCGSGWIEVRS